MGVRALSKMKADVEQLRQSCLSRERVELPPLKPLGMHVPDGQTYTQMIASQIAANEAMFEKIGISAEMNDLRRFGEARSKVPVRDDTPPLAVAPRMALDPPLQRHIRAARKPPAPPSVAEALINCRVAVGYRIGLSCAEKSNAKANFGPAIYYGRVCYEGELCSLLER